LIAVNFRKRWTTFLCPGATTAPIVDMALEKGAMRGTRGSRLR